MVDADYCIKKARVAPAPGSGRKFNARPNTRVTVGDLSRVDAKEITCLPGTKTKCKYVNYHSRSFRE